jgi:serine/threonine protein kinase
MSCTTAENYCYVCSLLELDVSRLVSSFELKKSLIIAFCDYIHRGYEEKARSVVKIERALGNGSSNLAFIITYTLETGLKSSNVFRVSYFSERLAVKDDFINNNNFIEFAKNNKKYKDFFDANRKCPSSPNLIYSNVATKIDTSKALPLQSNDDFKIFSYVSYYIIKLYEPCDEIWNSNRTSESFIKAVKHLFNFIDTIHNSGFVYVDFKTGNILYDKTTESLVLADFELQEIEEIDLVIAKSYSQSVEDENNGYLSKTLGKKRIAKGLCWTNFLQFVIIIYINFRRSHNGDANVYSEIGGKEVFEKLLEELQEFDFLFKEFTEMHTLMTAGQLIFEKDNRPIKVYCVYDYVNFLKFLIISFINKIEDKLLKKKHTKNFNDYNILSFIIMKYINPETLIPHISLSPLLDKTFGNKFKIEFSDSKEKIISYDDVLLYSDALEEILKEKISIFKFDV